MRSIEAESIDAAFIGGLGCNSDEASVMEVERRAEVKFPGLLTLNYIVKSDTKISTATCIKKHYYSNNKEAQEIGYIPQFSSMDSIIQESKVILK